MMHDGSSQINRIPRHPASPALFRQSPWALCALAISLPWSIATQAEVDIFDLDLRELVEVKVISVTKQEQKLSESAAAIHVISADDIRRAGINSLPEALRMVPGVMVHRINSNQWAVSARGFPSRFTRKLLTLINGRSTYDPTFAGTYWPLQDLPVEEVERIEVILGPGATLWGANAVNGIINVMTRNARDTHGSLLTAGVGDEERVLLYGGQGGETSFTDGKNKTHYRVFGSYKNHDGMVDTNGQDTHDNWYTNRVGFRTDTELAHGELLIEGDVMRMIANEVINEPFAPAPLLPAPSFNQNQPRKISRTYHLLGRWSESYDSGEHWSLQGYYDYSYQNTVVGTQTRTFDVEFQHGFLAQENHHLIWGVGARSLYNTIEPGNFSTWERSDTLELFSGFLQDEIRLLDDELRFTLGTKIEKSEYTGVEFQPNARFTWLAAENHVFWGALSRALRTPSRANRDMRALSLVSFAANDPASPAFGVAPLLVELRGDEDVREVESEELTAWELGYRFNTQSNLNLDLALFYNEYSNLNSQVLGPVEVGPGYLIQPLLRDNNLEGKAVGGEIAVNWQALPWWRLRADYSHFHVTLELEKPEPPPTTFNQAASDLHRQSPRHQANLRSQMDLDNDIALDFWLRHVSDIPAQGINAYVNMDARVGWKPVKDIELSLIGKNLLDDQQSEIRQAFITGPQADVERSFHVRASWNF